MNLPVLDRDAIRDVDRRAIEVYGIPGLILMENAGRGCVDVLCRLEPRGPVAICCGSGNNAGDGLVMARHLDARGIAVRLLFWSDPRQLRGDAALNYAMAVKANLDVVVCEGGAAARHRDRGLADAVWVVDALLGTGAQGPPRPPLDRVIDALNEHSARKLAVDIPSGLDSQTGALAPQVFRADLTCTFVAAKPGLLAAAARVYVGQLHVLDIGIPGQLLREFGLALAPPAMPD
jgi:NAD(P)H-hydrate epimerase